MTCFHFFDLENCIFLNQVQPLITDFSQVDEYVVAYYHETFQEVIRQKVCHEKLTGIWSSMTSLASKGMFYRRHHVLSLTPK